MPEAAIANSPSVIGNWPEDVELIESADIPPHFRLLRVTSTEVIELLSSEITRRRLALLAPLPMAMGPLKLTPSVATGSATGHSGVGS
jgi:hypothetical protein